MRNQLSYTYKLLGGKVKLHVGGILLKLVNQFLGRSPQHIVDPMYLVEFVFAWEQREQGQNFEEDTAHAPDVHLIPVMSVR